jgi:hypothetical protein
MKAWEVKVQLDSNKNFGQPNLPQLLTVATSVYYTTTHILGTEVCRLVEGAKAEVYTAGTMATMV